MDTSEVLPDPEPILQAAIRALPLAVLVLVGAALLHFVLGRSLDLLAARTRLAAGELDPIKKLLKTILHIVTAVVLLAIFGINLGGLWAVLSTILAMIAIGFVAVWSLLSNVSSTILILLSRPFAIGDEIEFAGEPVKGKVVDLNFLYTTLREPEGGLIQIPNNQFFQKSVKRRRGAPPCTLAQQLGRNDPAEV